MLFLFKFMSVKYVLGIENSPTEHQIVKKISILILYIKFFPQDWSGHFQTFS